MFFDATLKLCISCLAIKLAKWLLVYVYDLWFDSHIPGLPIIPFIGNALQFAKAKSGKITCSRNWAILRGFLLIMNEHAVTFVSRLTALKNKNIVDMEKYLKAYTLDVICGQFWNISKFLNCLYICVCIFGWQSRKSRRTDKWVIGLFENHKTVSCFFLS